MNVLVPLAEGFEEIEAVTIIDVLRRAEISVTTAYLKENPVTGSHDIKIFADTNISEADPASLDAVILPGGLPGSENLKNNPEVNDLIKKLDEKKGIVAAICAAPIVLGHAGLLKGKKATCYPGFEGEIKGEYKKEPVVVDSNIITGNGAGNSIQFALTIVEKLKGSKYMEDLKKSMQVYWI